MKKMRYAQCKSMLEDQAGLIIRYRSFCTHPVEELVLHIYLNIIISCYWTFNLASVKRKVVPKPSSLLSAHYSLSTTTRVQNLASPPSPPEKSSPYTLCLFQLKSFSSWSWVRSISTEAVASTEVVCSAPVSIAQLQASDQGHAAVETVLAARVGLSKDLLSPPM